MQAYIQSNESFILKEYAAIKKTGVFAGREFTNCINTSI